MEKLTIFQNFLAHASIQSAGRSFRNAPNNNVPQSNII